MSKFKIEFKETVIGGTNLFAFWDPIVNGWKEMEHISGRTVMRVDGSSYKVYEFMGYLYDTLPLAKAKATAYFKD